MANEIDRLATPADAAAAWSEERTQTAAPPTVTLLMPVLNEINGLKATLPFIDRTLVDDILVVDGGSTDGSVEYAESQGVVVTRQERPGLAWAVYDAIVRLDTDYVIEFSPDGNCPVEVLPELIQGIRAGYDLVVVSRYLPPAKSEDDTWLTAFGNWMFSRMFRYLGRFPVTDALTIYRGFRRNIVFSRDFVRLLAGPVFEPLVTGVCNLKGMRICEIPGDEPPRIGGASKMRPFYNGSCILLMVARLYVRKFFGWKV
jgi:glycosyltransferase involved in cell wall biosynthesis